MYIYCNSVFPLAQFVLNRFNIFSNQYTAKYNSKRALIGCSTMHADRLEHVQLAREPDHTNRILPDLVSFSFPVVRATA